MELNTDSQTAERSSPKILLYVSSLTGTISTLALTLSLVETKKAKLEVVASDAGCGLNATWLTLDYPKSILYCLDEAYDQPNGSLSSYKIESDGNLVQLDKVLTLGGPVSSVIYGHGGRGLAVAF